MKATVMYKAGDVRIDNVPDARIINSTDALVRVTRACICGSDLWPYKAMEPSETGVVMGHEAIGVVEDIAPAGTSVKLYWRDLSGPSPNTWNLIDFISVAADGPWNSSIANADYSHVYELYAKNDESHPDRAVTMATSW